MGQLISGFVEKSSSRYLSAQLIGWDVLDITWATTFRPAFLPRPADIELTPKLIARLPLLAGSTFPFPKSTLISNSVRLEVPTLDLPIWRERASAAGAPSVSKFEFSDNNSLLGPIAEAHERQFNAYSSRYTSPSVAHSSVRGAPRSPPKNNRSMILNKIVFTPLFYSIVQAPRAKSAPKALESSPSLMNRCPSVRSTRRAQRFDIASGVSAVP